MPNKMSTRSAEFSDGEPPAKLKSVEDEKIPKMCAKNGISSSSVGLKDSFSTNENSPADLMTKNPLLNPEDNLNSNRVEEFYRSNGDFDFIIISEGTEFPVHKAVLSKHSHYFEALLEGTTRMKEAQSNEICLQDIPKVTVKSVLNFMYSSDLSITWLNIDDLLNAASLLQIHSLIDRCSDWMSDNFDVHQYRNLAKLARLYSLDRVTDDLRKMVARKFRSYIEDRSLFFELEHDELLAITSQDCLQISSEKQLLKYIELWMKNSQGAAEDVGENDSHLSSLLSNVRYCLMTPADLAVLANASYPTRVSSLIQSAISYHQNFRMGIAVPSSIQNRLRSSEPSIVLVLETGVNHEILSCHPSEDADSTPTCYSLYTNMAHHKTCGVATVDNRLYVVSMEYDAGFDHNSDILFTYYDPCVRDKAPLPCPPSQIIPATVTAFDRKICLCGGVSRSNTVFVSYCEVFDVDTLKWEDWPHLPAPVHNCAAASLDGRLYVSGGQLQQPHRIITNQLLSLKPGEKEWQVLSGMNVARRGHSLIAADDESLLACGGLPESTWKRDGKANIPIERYNVNTNQWTEITNCSTLPGPSTGHFLLLPHQPTKLYMLGHELPDAQEHEIWCTNLGDENVISGLHMMLPSRYKLNYAFATYLYLNINGDDLKSRRIRTG